jgi:hypothetical protein
MLAAALLLAAPATACARDCGPSPPGSGLPADVFGVLDQTVRRVGEASGGLHEHVDAARAEAHRVAGGAVDEAMDTAASARRGVERSYHDAPQRVHEVVGTVDRVASDANERGSRFLKGLVHDGLERASEAVERTRQEARDRVGEVVQGLRGPAEKIESRVDRVLEGGLGKVHWALGAVCVVSGGSAGSQPLWHPYLLRLC